MPYNIFQMSIKDVSWKKLGGLAYCNINGSRRRCRPKYSTHGVHSAAFFNCLIGWNCIPKTITGPASLRSDANVQHAYKTAILSSKKGLVTLLFQSLRKFSWNVLSLSVVPTNDLQRICSQNERDDNVIGTKLACLWVIQNKKVWYQSSDRIRSHLGGERKKGEKTKKQR